MRRFALAALIVLFLSLGSAPVGPFKGVEPTNAQSDETLDRWRRENRRAIEDALFASGVIEAGQFPGDTRWVVTVRVDSAFDGTEIRFTMRQRYDHRVELSVTEPNGSSVDAQIRRLKQENPDANAEEIASLVAIQQRSLTDRNCPSLKALAADFEKVRVSPVLPDVLMMDAYEYRFWSRSLWGNHMEVFLSGPGPQAKRQPHPLLEWTEAVRSSIHGTCSRAGRDEKRPAHN